MYGDYYALNVRISPKRTILRLVSLRLAFYPAFWLQDINK